MARRVIAGMPQSPVPGATPNYANFQAAPVTPQMTAQRQAFMGMGGAQPVAPLFGGGKQGLATYGGMKGANADAINALDSGAGHML